MRESTRVLGWCAVLLSIGAAYTLHSLWAPLVMACWAATLLSPLLRRLSPERHKRRTAALLTIALVAVVLIPVIVIGAALTAAAIDLLRSVRESPNQTEALRALFLEGSDTFALNQLGLTELVRLLREHGRSAASALSAVAGATTKVVVGSVVFVLAAYVFLVDGARFYDWLAERAVMKRAYFDRLAAAFVETGRGLLIGTGLTALIQGALAMIGYLALGIPRPLVLGFLTAVASLIPAIGTALVWAPVSIGLAITRRYGAAAAMLVIGLVVSSADNFIRPALSRAGSLRLPTLAVFVAMLGGISVFGAWGLVLGPLLVRLAVEGLDVLRDDRRARGETASVRA